MKDFFTQLKDNLQNRPELSPTESDWEKMQAKMNPPTKPPRTIPIWGWFAIPIIALLGSNIWSIHRINQLEEKNSISTANEIILKKDTIYISKNIYHSDTVYLTNTIYKTIEKTNVVPQNSSPTFSQINKSQWFSDLGKTGSAFFSSTNFSKDLFSKNRKNDKINLLDYNNSKAVQLIEVENISNIRSKKENENHLNQNDRNINSSILSKELERLPSLSSQLISEIQNLDNIKFSAVAQTSKKKYWLRKKMNQLGNAFQPNGFQLGILGGYIYPIQEGVKNQNGFSVGLQANIEFSRNLSMWLNGSYQELNFEANRMDESIGIPIEQSPNAEYTFESAKVNTPSFHYSVGMQYLFNADKKFKPLIGVGYGVVSLLPYEILYEFEKENNSGNDPEINVIKDVETEDLLTNFILLRAGAQYQLTPRINFNLIGTYRTQTNPEGFSSPNLLNFQGGLMYKF